MKYNRIGIILPTDGPLDLQLIVKSTCLKCCFQSKREDKINCLQIVEKIGLESCGLNGYFIMMPELSNNIKIL